MANKTSRAREARAALAEDTLRILSSGGYTAPSGREVSIAEPLDKAMDGTRTLTPADGPRLPADRPYNTATTLANETTLEAGRRLVDEGLDLVILCLLYTSPSPRDRTRSRMPSSA